MCWVDLKYYFLHDLEKDVIKRVFINIRNNFTSGLIELTDNYDNSKIISYDFIKSMYDFNLDNVKDIYNVYLVLNTYDKFDIYRYAIASNFSEYMVFKCLTADFRLLLSNRLNIHREKLKDVYLQNFQSYVKN